jgi:hypothetical protein
MPVLAQPVQYDTDSNGITRQHNEEGEALLGTRGYQQDSERRLATAGFSGPNSKCLYTGPFSLDHVG